MAVAEIGTDLKRAIDLLKLDNLVAIPTETVYGLAANGLNSLAVSQIFQVKNRPHFDPLILHIGKIEQLEDLAQNIPQKAKILAQHFWPGPITLVLEKKDVVPSIVTSGLPTVGIRMPNHPMTLELLQRISFPLAAPSANPFKYVSPTTAQHVFNQLGFQIPYILDGGNCKIGIESTIVAFHNDDVHVLRLGGLSLEKIESVIGPVIVSTDIHTTIQAPGQLLQHYAPSCKLVSIVETTDKMNLDGLILLSKNSENQHKIDPKIKRFYLSEAGDILEASSNLFSVLRQLDDLDLKTVGFEWLEENGLGRAINDRLKRASN